MTITYTGGANNNGTNAAPSTGVHGITINDGDLVVILISSNSNTAMSDDSGEFTEAVDETIQTDTGRMAVYWKIADATEATSYTFTAANTQWQVIIKVFSADNPIILDSALFSEGSGANERWFVISASAGRTVATGAVSIIGAAIDDRDVEDAAYSVTADSYVSGVGTNASEAAAMAHRIWGAGGDDVATTLKTVSGDDGMPFAEQSFHISFVESGGVANPKGPLGMTLDGPLGGQI